MKLRAGVVSLAVAAGLLPASARAFKVETHVYVAEQVLQDAKDGRVTIPGLGEFGVAPAALAAIQSNPGAFRMGSAGPDAFPDLVGGQLTTHPGEGGWGTDQWLEWLLQNAGDAEERAFAYGYATHVAADVFSHTYVNGWAGEVFLLEDGIAEEIRHIAVEDFIRLHQPPSYRGREVIEPWENLDLPADFVARTLIRSAEAADRYRTDPKLRHLALMYDAWAAANGAIQKAEELKAKLDAVFSEAQAGVDAAQDAFNAKKAAIDDFHIHWPEVCGFGVCVGGWRQDFPDYPGVCLAAAVDPTGTIAGYCTAIATLDLTLQGAKLALESLNAISGLSVDATLLPLYDWRAAMEIAMREYVVASRQTIVAMMTDGDPMAPMRDWLAFCAPAFAGVPASLGGGACVTGNYLGEAVGAITGLRDKVNEKISEVPLLGWLVDPAWQVQNAIETELKPWATASAVDLVGAFGTDSPIFKLSQALLVEYDARALDDEFAHDASGAHLLEIPDIAERITAEMQLPSGFPVVRNAITLAKLALLPASELNRMVSERGISDTAYGTQLYQETTPFNVLLSSVLSIDGSHQWQESAPPYPRSDGVIDGKARHYGRAFDGERGFRLWHDCAARKLVFLTIFQGPLAPGLEEPERLGSFSPLLPDGSPFAGTTEPFDPFPLAPGSVLQDALPPKPDVSPLPTVYGECGLRLTTTPTATDICAGAIAGTTASQTSWDAPGTYSVLWRYFDGGGNQAKQEQAVKVVDTTPPSLTPPRAVTVEQEAHAGSIVELDPPVTSDACVGPIEVTDDRPRVYPLGVTTVHFTATDASGNSAHATTTVTVQDTRAPLLLDVPAPVAVEQVSWAGTPVDVPLPRATDICDSAPEVASDAPATFPLGTSVVTFTATDDSGNVGRATTSVTVVDTTAPVMESLTPSPAVLWPPNHKMVPVSVAVGLRDRCDVAPACQVTAVVSSEPWDAKGSGHTGEDWEIVGDLDLRLRAERTGWGTGRTYEITVRCLDASGNAAVARTQVIVPRDRS